MRPFQKLTSSEIAHLQHLISNVLETSTSPMPPPLAHQIASEQQNETTRLLAAELDNNKAVTAELASMACSILEEIAICLQDNKELREELELAHHNNKFACIEIGELREKLEELANENQQLRLNLQSYRNERDINIFKYELAVSNHEKQKEQLIAQLRSMQLRLQRVSSSKKAEQQKISTLRIQISELHQSKSRLQEELVTFKTLKLSLNSQENKCQVDEKDEQSIIKNQSQQIDTSIRESRTKLQGSSLKYELMEPIEIGGWSLETARYNPEYRQNKEETPRYPYQAEKKHQPTHIQELSEKDTNRDKSEYDYDSFSQIYSQSREDLDQQINCKIQNALNKVQIQKPLNKKNETSIKMENSLKSAVQSSGCPGQAQGNVKHGKAQPNLVTGFEKKMKKGEGKVSRIKYLLQALGGGDNGYKREKVQRFGVGRPQKGAVEQGEKKRLVLKKMISNATVTSCTMTPVPSVNLLRKQNCP